MSDKHPSVKPQRQQLNPVHLLRDGDFAVVRVEVNGEWIEVIREFADGPFSHIWEGDLPSGNHGHD